MGQRGENMQAEILSIMHAEKSAYTVRLDYIQKPRPGATPSPDPGTPGSGCAAAASV